jgi:hypothetical protein
MTVGLQNQCLGILGNSVQYLLRCVLETAKIFNYGSHQYNGFVVLIKLTVSFSQELNVNPVLDI